MSHVSTIHVQMKNLNALERACKRLGLEFRRNKETFNWWGTTYGAIPEGMTKETMGKCDHSVAIQGSEWLDKADCSKSFEVGLVANKNAPGTWTFAYDSYSGGRGLMAKVGPDCKTLMQMYALEVAREEAQTLVDEGWEMTELKQPNGDITLKLTQGAGVFGGASSGWGS